MKPMAKLETIDFIVKRSLRHQPLPFYNKRSSFGNHQTQPGNKPHNYSNQLNYGKKVSAKYITKRNSEKTENFSYHRFSNDSR